MCQAVIEYGDEREAIGKAKRLIQIISNIMANTKCTLENAILMAGTTMEDYEDSLALLESKKMLFEGRE